MITLTLEELTDRLATNYDEVSILEILEIDSFQLVERFKDLIENNYERILALFQETEEETELGNQEV